MGEKTCYNETNLPFWKGGLPVSRYLPHTCTFMALPANRLSLAAYLSLLVMGLIPILQYVSWLIPLFFFLSERDSGLLRFHALQACLLGLCFRICSGILWVTGIFSAAAAAFAPFLRLPSFLGPISAGVAGGLFILWVILVLAQLALAIWGMADGVRWQTRPFPLLGRPTLWILRPSSPVKVGPVGSGCETQADPLDYHGGIPRRVDHSGHGESSPKK